MRYVLGEEGTYADLRETGTLAAALHQELQASDNREHMVRRREYVRERFGWENLTLQYVDMFNYCLSAHITT